MPWVGTALPWSGANLKRNSGREDPTLSDNGLETVHSPSARAGAAVAGAAGHDRLDTLRSAGGGCLRHPPRPGHLDDRSGVFHEAQIPSVRLGQPGWGGPRVFAGVIGFLATWWVGALVAWILARVSLWHEDRLPRPGKWGGRLQASLSFRCSVPWALDLGAVAENHGLRRRLARSHGIARRDAAGGIHDGGLHP